MKHVICYLMMATVIGAHDARADFWNTLTDIATLGETARQRDRRTAEHERDVAAGERAKQEALHQQKIENLKKLIDGKNQEIQAWKEINIKSPEIESVLASFVDSASSVRQQRIENASYLQRIKKLFTRESHDLETVTSLLEAVIARTTTSSLQKVGGSVTTESAKDLKSSWNLTVDSMKQLATLRNQKVLEYLEAAEKASSDESLALFITQATVLRSYIVEMDAKVEQQIQNHQAEKEKFENELKQLIEKKTQPVPQPPPVKEQVHHTNPAYERMPIY